MPPRAVYLPEWFLEVAEGLARRRLTSEGKPETLSLANFQATTRKIPKVVSESEATAARWAKWLLANPEERPLSPMDEDSFSEYLKSLRKEGTPYAAAEVRRYRPHDGGSADAARQGAE
jgi:hypothetical protein